MDILSIACIVFLPPWDSKKKKELATREVSMHVICYQV